MSRSEYTPRQAADALGIGIATVRRHITAGILPATKRGGRWVLTDRDLETWRQGRAPRDAATSGEPDLAELKREARRVQRDLERLLAKVERVLSNATPGH